MFNGALMSLLTLILVSFIATGCDSSETTKTAALSPELQQGKEIVEGRCFACHAQSINGAPIVGNEKMWKTRATQGKTVLVEHAINGIGLMPAKGGFTDLSDEEIGLAVGYMLSQIKE
ncbi:c-type cytochrome [Neptuniibacter sp. QD37_6]|uniref:c-type cytochrome n=1 Tax=Neptuniibacter sp. QD37_6 TaxID=3398210 RepID=UPI0039F466AA